MENSALEIIGLPAFTDNYIWLLRNRGHVAAVDPGDAAPVLAHLAASGDRLSAILLTHHHPDHSGGVARLLAAQPVPVYGPAIESIAGVSHPLQGGEQLDVPGIDAALQVLAVPGHTRGHLAYYGPSLRQAGALFCGDTLFGAGCGRLFEGTAEQMHASLAQLAALPAPTFIYCAHEYTQANLRFALAVEPANPATQQRAAAVARQRQHGQPTVPSTLAIELDTNPFLRWDASAVIDAAASRLDRRPRNAGETFAAIREWRNHF